MKRWWLPTQKGTELFPNAVVAPPKLVIEGAAPGTPLYHSIAQRFGGELKRFHGKCQQDYAISSTSILKRRARLGDDATATYSNQYGQETLTLRISAEAVKRLEEKPEIPWDWALLEYYVPFTGSALHMNMRARRVMPFPAEAGILREGYVYDTQADPLNVDGLVPPVTKYPAELDSATFFTSVDELSQISSLAIDMRRFNRGPSMYDLSGYLSVSNELVPSSYFGAAMDFQSSTDFPLGTSDYDETTNSWTPTLSTVLNAWPYYGAALMPEAEGGGVDTSVAFVTEGDFVTVEDAPKAPVTMVASPLETMTGSDGDGTEQTQTLDWGSRVTYDPISGIATEAIASVIGNTFELISGPNEPGVWRYTFSYQDQVYSREIGTNYDAVPIPATNVGDISWVAGYGAPPWTAVQVATTGDPYNRFALAVGADYQFLATGVLRRNVPIFGGGTDYDPVGRFVIDPVTKSAAFELP